MRRLKPCLVVAIDFLEWTADNRLRHATLKRIFFTNHSPRHILSRTGELCTSKHLTRAGKNLQSRAKRYALNKDPHLNPLPCRERGNRYSIFEPPGVPLVGPAPCSSGWPLAGDVDAFVDDTPDDVPDNGSGLIGATPEFAVVVDDADVLEDAVAGCATSGGVSVWPLKFSGSWPCSIAGVTTKSPPSELRHTV